MRLEPPVEARKEVPAHSVECPDDAQLAPVCAWWLRTSIAEGRSPWWTEYLYYPEGISLKRHTLSPYNAGLGAFLGLFFSPHATFDLVMLWHLVFSGWTFSILARYVTGSTPGAILGGLVYSFAPFHLYYVCQVNVFTWEFVPLALLFFLRYYSEGRGRDLVGVGLAMLAIAASTSYFVMYTFMMAGLLFLFGRAWDGSVSWRKGAGRTALAGIVGALGVVVRALPLGLRGLDLSTSAGVGAELGDGRG